MLHKSFTSGGALSVLERALRGRDDVFFDLLEASAQTGAEAARLLLALLEQFPDGADCATRISALEERADGITQEIVRRLSREVAAPLERTDILELARALDDITDHIEESGAAFALYRVEASMVQADAMAAVLVAATSELCCAVRKAVRLQPIADHTVEVHRLENEGDRLVGDAIASLFIDGIDPLVVLRWMDIFEQLEAAIDATERAAFVLESIVIKNI